MKFRRESTAFLYPGQRRWFLWINVLFILENLVSLCTLGTYWADLSSVARENYYQRFTRIDYLD